MSASLTSSHCNYHKYTMLASEVHSSILTRTHESDSVLQGDPDRVADLPALHHPVPGGPHLLPLHPSQSWPKCHLTASLNSLEGVQCGRAGHGAAAVAGHPPCCPGAGGRQLVVENGRLRLITD